MQFLLASYPRSGNTFFRVILSHRYGLTVHTDRPPPAEWGKIGLAAADGTGPLFHKTHSLPAADDPRPAVYIVRDGRDALVSYAHFTLAYGQPAGPAEVTPAQFRDTLRNLILETGSRYGTWAQNVDAWAARPNTAVVRYEDLVADPAGVADRALADIRLAREPVADHIPAFDELKEVDGKFFRRGVTGGWRDEFPPELLDLFWAHNGTAMLRHGYPHHRTARAA
jgi:hypothetical protein